jgi:hypothetical protein
MKNGNRLARLGLAAVLALPAFAAAQKMPPGAIPGMAGGAAAPALDPAVMKTTTLTDAQVQGFIGAMEDFDDLSKKGGGQRKIYSVLQQGGKEVVAQKLDEAKVQQEKAIKQMQQHLSPEQLKAIQGQMGAGMAIANNMRDVPDANLALMEKYRPQMEKLANR